MMNVLIAQEKVKLYSDKDVDSNGLEGPEVVDSEIGHISNVSEAEIWIYKVEKENNTRKAVVICPGGGYKLLAMIHEGVDLARWLNQQGVTAIVLKYRMPNEHKCVPLSDVQEAISYIRSKSEELNIDPHRVGVAGFSAGGHLAATASTYINSDKDVRPNFCILYYPVITMGELTHSGSREALLGLNPNEDDINTFSCEDHVSRDTPRTIIFASSDDKGVPVANSTTYYQELINKKIEASLYIFPTGGHGWGMNQNFEYHNQMLELLSKWLKSF